MKALFREETPYSLRLFIVVTVLAAAIYGWLLIVNGAGVVTVTSTTVGSAILVIAFFLVGVLRTRRYPLMPLWISLGIGAIWSALMMLSIPAPPHWGSSLFLGAIVVLCVAAALLASRKPRVALGLLVALGVLGLYGVLVVPIAVWNGHGSRIQGTGGPVAILGAACLAALWHAWSVRSRAGTYGGQ